MDREEPILGAGFSAIEQARRCAAIKPVTLEEILVWRATKAIDTTAPLRI